jgi:hypothetical protein
MSAESAFRVIVCFQWFNRRFVSRFFTHPLSRPPLGPKSQRDFLMISDFSKKVNKFLIFRHRALPGD